MVPPQHRCFPLSKLSAQAGRTIWAQSCKNGAEAPVQPEADYGCRFRCVAELCRKNPASLVKCVYPNFADRLMVRL
jgi:hypothetical protein